MIRVATFAGKSVAVFGLGQSGIVAARALRDGGAEVLAWDDNAASRDAAAEHGVPIVDLNEADWKKISALVLAPGVPLTHPEPHWTVKCAREAGVEIIGDVELFCRQRAVNFPKAPFVAITGTNGKSTTTALIAHLLKVQGHDVQMGGNIGRPVLDLAPFSPQRIYVVEVSSFQIDLAPTCRPSVGVLLNVTPDHLDRHGTLEHYAAVKHRLIKASDLVAVSLDDSWSRAAIDDVDAARQYIFTVGAGSGVVPKFYANGTTLFMHQSDGTYATSTELADLEQSTSLRGVHNVQNALAALASLRALQDWIDLCSASEGRTGSPIKVWDEQKLRDGLATFPGLPHRLEQVGRLGPVMFVNDSKATNAIAAEKALSAFGGNIYWIVGGRAKEDGIDELAPLFARVSKAYLIGEAQDRFAQTLATKDVSFENSGTLEVAVVQAAQDARDNGGREAVVLLSPACASFDQFKNFEDRGEAFRRSVAGLEGVVMADVVSVVGQNPVRRDQVS